MIGMSFRDLGTSIPVVPRSRCFQTGVEAVGGRGGRPQLVDWSKLLPIRLRLEGSSTQIISETGYLVKCCVAPTAMDRANFSPNS